MAWVHSEVLCFSSGLRIPLATCLVLEAQPPGTVQAGVMRPPTLCRGDPDLPDGGGGACCHIYALKNRGFVLVYFCYGGILKN